MRKVLIANRGEIAVRISRTLREMGIKSVAVYSDPDAGAVHVSACDEAWPLEGITAAETYLSIEKLVAIATACSADAVHPGYGFLSENAAFARACTAAGLVFIGPSPEVIAKMGDKVIAKGLMQAAGVPVVPGWTGDAAALSEMTQAAEAIGYPVLIKAAAGGGGKGMRTVDGPNQLAEAVLSAQREAAAAFGDARIFMEKYLPTSRHIEFQIFGDAEGHVVHLFERECSIQRRHQKVIEEAPSPALTPALRQAMGESAVQAARAIGYTNAGTVEFILAPDGQFYFLEVNTRLQVEHPVTECIVGVDLVAAQVAVARGKPLPWSQDDLQPRGHAIECRIYAEDPAHGFLPSTGTLAHYCEPSGPWVRVDSGVAPGSAVTVYYDPMLAKLIVWASTRDAACDKLSAALADFPVLGVTTNIGYLQRIVTHPAFRAGTLDTQFLTRYTDALLSEESVPDLAWALAALPANRSSTATVPQADNSVDSQPSPWQTAGHWRANE